jgi:diguanylate cyclase (GGDEF)-like protein/PAS domain S-box-containing protein
VRVDQEGARGLAGLRGLHRVLAKVSGVRDLDATLQAVVDGVVEAVGFEVAAVNCVRPDGVFEMRAVAGSQEARATLMGSVTAPEEFAVEFARADHWGELRFVPHERLEGPVPGWVPSGPAAAVAGGWHPEDALFAPLHAASGDLVGVLAVDLPRDGRRPGPLQRELLEIFAAHAGIAIENARLAEQLRQEHERLRASEESLSLAFDGSDVGMAMLGLGPIDAGRFLRVNPALERMTGFTAEQLTTMHVSDLSHPDDLEANRDGLRQALSKGGTSYHLESRYVKADGSLVWLSVSNAIIRNGRGDVLHGFVQVQDMTERRATEQQLRRAATRDPLTGLLNRAALETHLESAVASVRRTRRPGAVIFCDLDSFKAVNDSLGHDAGDTVLRVVATRLQATVRSSDAVARLGGDEFVLVVSDVDEASLRSLVARLLDDLAQPVEHLGRPLRVTASLGVSVLDEHAAEPATILRQADTAMYQAKQAGRNRHVFHTAMVRRGLSNRDDAAQLFVSPRTVDF